MPWRLVKGIFLASVRLAKASPKVEFRSVSRIGYVASVGYRKASVAISTAAFVYGFLEYRG